MSPSAAESSERSARSEAADWVGHLLPEAPHDALACQAIRALDAARDDLIAAGDRNLAQSLAFLPRLAACSLRRGQLVSRLNGLSIAGWRMLCRQQPTSELLHCVTLLRYPLHQSIVLLHLAQWLSHDPALAAQCSDRSVEILWRLWETTPHVLVEQLCANEYAFARQLLDLLFDGPYDIIELLAEAVGQLHYGGPITVASVDVLNLIKIGLLALRSLARSAMPIDLRASDLLGPTLDAARVARTERAWRLLVEALRREPDVEALLTALEQPVYQLSTMAARLPLFLLIAQLRSELGKLQDATISWVFSYLSMHTGTDDADNLCAPLGYALVLTGLHHLMFPHVSGGRLWEQVASLLLRSERFPEALALIAAMYNNPKVRCELLLDASLLLRAKGQMAEAHALEQEVGDLLVLIRTPSYQQRVANRLNARLRGRVREDLTILTTIPSLRSHAYPTLPRYGKAQPSITLDLDAQRDQLLTLLAQADVAAAVALIDALPDPYDQHGILLTMGEALTTLERRDLAPELIAALVQLTHGRRRRQVATWRSFTLTWEDFAHTMHLADARLLVLLVRLGAMSLADLERELPDWPLVKLPGVAQVLAEHGYLDRAQRLLGKTDALQPTLTLAQCFADQGYLRRALDLLTSLSAKLERDSYSAACVAHGTRVKGQGSTIAQAANRNAALCALAEIMVKVGSYELAMTTMMRVTSVELRAAMLQRMAYRVHAQGAHKIARRYARELLNSIHHIADLTQQVQCSLDAGELLRVTQQTQRAMYAIRQACQIARYIPDRSVGAALQRRGIDLLLAYGYRFMAIYAVEQIDDVSQRVAATSAILAAAPLQHWSELDRLIQRPLCAAETYADALAWQPLVDSLA